MNSTSSCLSGWLLGNALLLRATLAGEVTQESREPVPEVAPIPGVFNTELPPLVLPESLRLTLRPHFGDFINHDYFRLTLGARYGLTPQWELSGDVDAYIAHGLGDVRVGEELGVSKIRLGVKYRFTDFLLPYWEAVAGLKYSFPVGNPPEELTNGLHHLTPYMTLAHKWESRPDFTSFVSYGVDIVTRTYAVDTIEDGQINASHWFITPGVVWQRGAFNYSLEAVLSSTVGLDSREEYRVTVRPGVKWTLPPRLTFHSRSRWIIGVSVHADYGSDGTNIGASLRLQTDFDFRRLFKGRPRPDVDTAK